MNAQNEDVMNAQNEDIMNAQNEDIMNAQNEDVMNAQNEDVMNAQNVGLEPEARTEGARTEGLELRGCRRRALQVGARYPVAHLALRRVPAALREAVTTSVSRQGMLPALLHQAWP